MEKQGEREDNEVDSLARGSWDVAGDFRTVVSQVKGICWASRTESEDEGRRRNAFRAQISSRLVYFSQPVSRPPFPSFHLPKIKEGTLCYSLVLPEKVTRERAHRRRIRSRNNLSNPPSRCEGEGRESEGSGDEEGFGLEEEDH